MEMINVRRDDVARIVAATFPGYRGRKIRVGAREKVGLHDLNWSGGSRSEYRAVTLDGIPLGSTAKYAAMAPWAHHAEGATLPVPEGACIVEHSIFCGKDTGLRIYVNPADMPKLLPAPRV